MSLQLDNTLGLVYKNMVGLSNIVVDTSANTYLVNSLSINSNLYASGNTTIMGSTSIYSNLKVIKFYFISPPASPPLFPPLFFLVRPSSLFLQLFFRLFPFSSVHYFACCCSDENDD